MRFTLAVEVAWPRDLVFQVQRDHLPDLVPYLPNVEEIVRTFREDDGPITRVRNSWRGSSSEIPAVIRPMVRPELLSWHDTGHWDATRHRCEWQTFLPLLEGAITSKGITSFEAEGDETIVRVDGEFTLDPNRLSLVPLAVGRIVAPAFERFVIGVLEPNMRRTFEAVETWIEENS